MSAAPWRVTDVNSGFFHSVLALYTQSSFCLVFCVKLNRKPTGFWVYSYPCFLLSLFCISWPSFHPLLASSAHCTMARSLSTWLRCFLALYPGRRNSIFLFLASILFLCFFSFFFAAMSGFATACRDRRRNCEDDRWQIKAVSRVCLIAMSIIPAWLCVVCVPLVSVRIPSGRQRRPGRISPGPHVSSSARWAPEQGSSVWDLDQRLGDNRGHSVYLTLFVRMVFFYSWQHWFRAVTLVCVCAVQLSVQWRDYCGQIRGEPFFPQVHGHCSQELKHARSLREITVKDKQCHITGTSNHHWV